MIKFDHSIALPAPDDQKIEPIDMSLFLNVINMAKKAVPQKRYRFSPFDQEANKALKRKIIISPPTV